MVNGIFTIPLPGHTTPWPGEPNAATHRLSEFVAGPENLLAAQAIRPFLDRAVGDYSPLVLYGPPGSGKSHLAQGLAAWWRRHMPGESVVSLSAAEFAQEYAAAIESQRLEAWRRRIRGAALLIVEDLGQLGGKRGAQQELQHALDWLAERESPVLLTAGTLPAHWSILLPSLRGRLSAGLAVPLALPDTNTRRAILERIAAARGITIPKRAAKSLAEGLRASVPTLIAAIMELEFAAADDGQVFEPERVREFVAARENAKMPSMRDIARVTARYFDLKLADFQSPLRRRRLVAGRSVAMYLARELTDKSLEQIGAFFGGRDHTTVLYGCRRTEKLLRRDRATRQAVADLKKLLVA